ncbi:hypothetical protein [Stenotrophomonas bentonitica]
MKSLYKVGWYGAALVLPLIAQSTYVGHIAAPRAGAAYYLAVSLLLTAIQIGQAAAFQVTLAHRGSYQISKRLSRGLMVIATVAISLALTPGLAMPVKSGAIIVLGIGIGSLFSVRNAHLLNAGTEVIYFRKLFLRNALVLGLCVSIANLVAKPGMPHIAAIAFATLLFSMHRLRPPAKETRDQSLTLSSKDLATMGIGIAAASLYRNDQNLVRSFSLSTAAFASVHNSLLGGSAIQSLVGAVLTTFILPKVREQSAAPGLRLVLDASAMLFFVALCLVATLYDTPTITILCGSAILAINQWWSYKLHLRSKSIYVYLSGTFAFALLSALLAAGIRVELSYFLFAIVTSLSVLTLGYVVR